MHANYMKFIGFVLPIVIVLIVFTLITASFAESVPENLLNDSNLDSELEGRCGDLVDCLTQSCKDKYIEISLSQSYNKPTLNNNGKREWNVTYEIEVRNTGDIKIKNVLLNATLPENLTYIISYYKYGWQGTLPYPTRIQNPDGTTRFLSWFIDDLRPDENLTIFLVTSFEDRKEVDLKQNKICVSAEALCLKYKSEEVSATGPSSSLVVNQEINDINKDNNNTIISYIISIKNSGQIPISDIKLADYLPDNATYLNSSLPITDLRKDVISINIGNLDIGSFKNIILNLESRDKDSPIQMRDNRVNINGYGSGIYASNTSNEAYPLKKKIVIIQFIEERNENSFVAYHISIINQGYSKLKNINLTNILPEDVTYINATGVNGKELSKINIINDAEANTTILKWPFEVFGNGQDTMRILINASYNKSDPNINIRNNKVIAEVDNLVLDTSDEALFSED